MNLGGSRQVGLSARYAVRVGDLRQPEVENLHERGPIGTPVRKRFAGLRIAVDDAGA